MRIPKKLEEAGLPAVAVVAAVGLIGGAVWAVAQANEDDRAAAQGYVQTHAEGDAHQRLVKDLERIERKVDGLNEKLDDRVGELDGKVSRVLLAIGRIEGKLGIEEEPL